VVKRERARRLARRLQLHAVGGGAVGLEDGRRRRAHGDRFGARRAGEERDRQEEGGEEGPHR
jgi:hypothetical protein